MNESRRQFIKKSCGLCASIVGLSVLAASLDSCTPLKYVNGDISTGKISVASSNFVENSKLVIVKHAKLDYDIALVKTDEKTYRAFELKCTHQDNALVPTSTGFHCNLHGSSYTLEGKVNSTPATTPLKEYKIQVVGEIVEIVL